MVYAYLLITNLIVIALKNKISGEEDWPGTSHRLNIDNQTCGSMNMFTRSLRGNIIPPAQETQSGFLPGFE
jgi:hypothetical protein